jgi:RNA polymerase sigma factor for flagellar operon FliA
LGSYAAKPLTAPRKDIKETWLAYKKTPTQALRNVLMENYLHLVRYNAERIHVKLPDEVELDDLMSAGIFGLMDAIAAFDLERGVKFETYCAPRIRGAILDELRSMDWVPRSVRARARQIERAIAELEARFGRAPTDEEISKKLGISEDELEESLGEISRSSIAALDELWTVSSSGGGDQVALIDTIEDESAPDPQGTLSVTEQKEALADAIARLPEREKLVVTLYYYEELTLREIGEVLGVTESRVSQLHTKAILRLKAHIASFGAAAAL